METPAHKLTLKQRLRKRGLGWCPECKRLVHAFRKGDCFVLVTHGPYILDNKQYMTCPGSGAARESAADDIIENICKLKTN